MALAPMRNGILQIVTRNELFFSEISMFSVALALPEGLVEHLKDQLHETLAEFDCYMLGTAAGSLCHQKHTMPPVFDSMGKRTVWLGKAPTQYLPKSWDTVFRLVGPFLSFSMPSQVVEPEHVRAWQRGEEQLFKVRLIFL